ncbi:MAG: hypothetical protein AAF512_04400, partial [Pseudomonadota bacterium]
GETGQLSINNDGVIQRGLIWAQFTGGKPNLLGPPVPPEENIFDEETIDELDENPPTLISPVAEY